MKQFFRKLKRLYEFIPHIWNSYDWDSRYAIELFKYQLQRTSRCLTDTKYLVHTTSEHDSKRIQLVLRLLDYAYNDIEEEKVRERYEFMYGKHNIDFVPNNDKQNTYSLESRWEYAISDSHNDDIHESYYKEIHKAMARQERAKTIAWKIVSQDIDRWWI